MPGCSTACSHRCLRPRKHWLVASILLCLSLLFLPPLDLACSPATRRTATCLEWQAWPLRTCSSLSSHAQGRRDYGLRLGWLEASSPAPHRTREGSAPSPGPLLGLLLGHVAESRLGLLALGLLLASPSGLGPFHCSQPGKQTPGSSGRGLARCKSGLGFY